MILLLFFLMKEEILGKRENMLTYNVHDGELEAMVHGFKNGFLRTDEYNNLAQCDSLNDLKSQLQVTEYGNFLQNEGAITTRVIVDRAMQKLVLEYMEIRDWAVPPLSTFLDFISYDYMLSNVLKLIAAKRSGRDSLDILYRCHPLGSFPGMSSLLGASTVEEMFAIVLVDSPIGKFFSADQQRDFDERSVEYIRGALQKNYLEAFYAFCEGLGGETASVMCPVLEFEADRLVITIAANTAGMRELLPTDRRRLYPNFGDLIDVHDDLADCESVEQLKEKLKRFPQYSDVFEDAGGIGSRAGSSGGGERSMERRFVEKAVQVYRDAMMKQFQYGCFYGWIRLKELEISNLQWIADCIAQSMKVRVHEYVPIVG